MSSLCLLTQKGKEKERYGKNGRRNNEKKNLYDAATKGEVTRFQQVLQEDPYLLDVVSFAYSRNLLHIATLRGQVGIVEEALKINPELARNLDAQKSSPLHMAAAQGSFEIASKLSSVAPETCWWRDGRGMNPIHIAAVNGHVEILEMLVARHPCPAREKADRGKTVLHLCVKHCQLRALQALANNLGELAHVEDDDGETILHLAVRYKQVEIVQYLVENSRVEDHSTNTKGKTALQISKEIPEDTCYSEITKILKRDGKSWPGFRKANEVVLMVSILIAGMTFQAAITPPGGVWQDDSPTHKAGTAIMASRDHVTYEAFVSGNTAAFVSSLITILACADGLTPTNVINLAAIWLGFFYSVFYFCTSFLISVLAISDYTDGSPLFSLPLAVWLVFIALRPHFAYVEPKLRPRLLRIHNYCDYIVTELSSLFRHLLRLSDATSTTL